jgi:hypothetical protein
MRNGIDKYREEVYNDQGVSTPVIKRLNDLLRDAPALREVVHKYLDGIGGIGDDQ